MLPASWSRDGGAPPPRDSVLHDILHFKEVVSLATEVVFYIFISSGKSGVHQREDAKEKEMGREIGLIDTREKINRLHIRGTFKRQ